MASPEYLRYRRNVVIKNTCITQDLQLSIYVQSSITINPSFLRASNKHLIISQTSHKNLIISQTSHHLSNFPIYSIVYLLQHAGPVEIQ